MPELRREVRLGRLNGHVFRWIEMFGFEQPFEVSELWSAAGRTRGSVERLSDEEASALCREYTEQGLMEAAADGRFKATRAFTRENVAALMKGRSTSPSETFDPTGKDRDQKFQILLSLNQGRREFAEAMKTCQQSGLPISLVFIDIDNFKQFNSKYSNAVIDRTLLPEFMELLRAHCAYRAHACLQGGDEFLLVLPNCTTEEAYVFVDRFRLRIREHVFHIDGAIEKLTISAGIATWPTHGADFGKVVEAANRAEERAKAQRDTVATAP